MSIKELIQLIRNAINRRIARIENEQYSSTDIRVHLLDDIDVILKDVMEGL